jgi:hypothetical protein
MDTVRNRTPSSCTQCGQTSCEHTLKRDILVEKGDVRRAFRAVDVVLRSVTTHGRAPNGVLLMTAVLLVERLATSLDRDPLSVLTTMARCFDIKRKFARDVKERSYS